MPAMFKFLCVSCFSFLSIGLTESVSPCGLTTIIFFAYFLFFAKLKLEQKAVVGGLFIGSFFVTSLFIGLGTFEYFRGLELFHLLYRVIYYLVAFVSIILGVFSIRDWWVYKKTNDLNRLILKMHFITDLETQTPTIGQEDKSIFKKSLFWLRISAVTMIVGFIAPILQSSCSGEVFLPMIVYILKAQGLFKRGYLYLAMYNIALIFLLLLIYWMVLKKLKSQHFRESIERNLAKIKMIFSAMFFGLGFGLMYLFR